MEADDAINTETVEIAKRLTSIDWISLDSIKEVCKEHPSQYKKALKILQSGDVRNLNCISTENERFRVHAYVHSEYKSCWYSSNIYTYSLQNNWSFTCVCQQRYV